MDKDHALARNLNHDLRTFSANELVRPEVAKALELAEGLAIPIRTGAGEGELFLEALPNLSTDHIDLGNEAALNVVGHIERHALMRPLDDGAGDARAGSQIVVNRALGKKAVLPNPADAAIVDVVDDDEQRAFAALDAADAEAVVNDPLLGKAFR